MLEESISLSKDTNNPNMDDEDFEFYALDIDDLNKNSDSMFINLIEIYKNKVDKNLNVL